MDRIEKFLRKLDQSRVLQIKLIIQRISANDFAGLDVRKLKGSDVLCRVLVGKVRVKFIRQTNRNIIVEIGFRNDNTY